MTSLGLVERKKPGSKKEGSTSLDPEKQSNTLPLVGGYRPNLPITTKHFYEPLHQLYIDFHENWKVVLKTDEKRRFNMAYEIKAVQGIWCVTWYFQEIKKAQGQQQLQQSSEDKRDSKEVKSSSADSSSSSSSSSSASSSASTITNKASGKKCIKMVKQALYPHVATFNIEKQKDITVVFKTMNNQPILEQLQSLVAEQSNLKMIDLASLKNTLSTSNGGDLGASSSSSSSTVSSSSLLDGFPAASIPDEKQLAREREKIAKEEARVRAIREEELAAASPLDYKQPLAFEEQKFSDSGSILFGIDKDELQDDDAVDGNNDNCDQDGETSTNTAATVVDSPAEVQEQEPTEEEMNAVGKDQFQSSHIHDLTVLGYNLIVKHFYPELEWLSSGSNSKGLDGRPIIYNTPTGYILSDLQPYFENHYSKLVKCEEFTVKIWPLTRYNPTGNSNRDIVSGAQLRIRGTVDRESTPFTDADNFHFLIRFKFSRTDNVYKFVDIAPSWDTKDNKQFKLLNNELVLFVEDLKQELEKFSKELDSSLPPPSSSSVLSVSSSSVPKPQQTTTTTPTLLPPPFVSRKVGDSLF